MTDRHAKQLYLLNYIYSVTSQCESNFKIHINQDPSLLLGLKLISDSDNLPALINCAYGKDRTGIFCALMLSCLGMPKDDVAREYAMSTVSF